jgi:putative tricarboxylic transport membrane protein
MDLFNDLVFGFGLALTANNLAYCFFGVLIGTLIGVLPGIGPLATIAMLMPITFKLPPNSALIMLAGIYYGSQYGGSTTSILMNIPGEAASIVTCLDGHAMARKGRAGPALAIAALGSLFAGCVSTIIIAVLSPPLAKVALSFGPAEYFSMMVLGLTGSVLLARGSVLNGFAMVLLGLLMGIVGTDIFFGTTRFTLGIDDLIGGIDMLVVVMGLFAFTEVISSLERTRQIEVLTTQVGRILPTCADLKASWKAVLRGTALGSMLGVLPGGGALLSSFASYTLEKKIASDPSRFGEGAIEGVAGPESANNAGAQTSFIPMLTLGIPTNATMAIILGMLIMNGIAPGPMVMKDRPDLFWGFVASLWIGNVMLVVLNLPLIGIWVRLLTVPYKFLYPGILVFCCIGVYSYGYSSFDVIMSAGFGMIGYIFLKLDCEPTPLILGFILGPMMEVYLRRAMTFSRGNPMVFFTRPISLLMLLAATFLMITIIVPAVRRNREKAFMD